MEAITREEKLMSAASSGKSSGIKPITREEMFLSYIAGESKKKPKPITRKEMFLDKIEKGEGGGTSGGGDIVPLLEGTIEEITIPNEVTKLRVGGFVGCDDLRAINADESHEVYKSSDGILYTKDGKKLVSYPPAKEETEYIMPDSVEEVEGFAFNNTTRLEKVIVGENFKTASKFGIENEDVEITLIADADILNEGGVYPFESETINAFVIPEDATFVSVTALDTLPNVNVIYHNGGELEVVGVTDIKGYTSYYTLFSYLNDNIKKLVVNIKNISNKYYVSNRDIKHLIIGENVETIENMAFFRKNIFNLTIGNGVKTIGYSAFSDALMRFDGTLIIPDSVTEFVTGESGICYTFSNAAITGLVIGKGLTEIGSSVFIHCAKLTEVTIPSNIKTIKERAFGGCSSLARVNIEEGVETIEGYAFEACYNLTDLYLPRSVTSIDAEGFSSLPTTIHGYAGSYAETFAKTNFINFEVIEE